MDFAVPFGLLITSGSKLGSTATRTPRESKVTEKSEALASGLNLTPGYILGMSIHGPNICVALCAGAAAGSGQATADERLPISRY